jgi:hypothetical protein
MNKRRNRPTADSTRSAVTLRIAVLGVVAIAPATLLTQRAFADTAKVIIPSGPFSDGQNIAVSGSGFPTRAQDPTGLQVIECSDPQGSPANLPTDPGAGCEGITVNPSQINTDSSGRFRASYLIAALSTSAGTSSIDCDATHQCVLWVGTDYNNAFLSGPHAFTAPFTVTGGRTTGPSTTPVAPASGAPTAVPSGAGTGTSSSSTSSEGSLASTGLPGLVLWLFALGVPLALVGLLGRRLTVVRVRTPD